jgi:glyoxylase-like metal-dependent hydrolase (beta-lactamase superfamily II)
MLLGLALLLASPATASPETQRLDDHTVLIPGGIEPGRQPDGNSIIIEGPQGVVVVDTGRHPTHADAILAATRGKPIVAIVNSHWHLDHTSGNPRLKAKFPQARVYASNAIDAALTGFLADSAKQGRDALASGKLPATIAEDVRGDLTTVAQGAKLRPDIVIAHSQVIALAGRVLDVNLAPHAATAGDVWLFDPASKRVIAGDLVTLPAPFLDTACPQGWEKALGAIAALDFTSLVPGHGPVMTREDFDAWHLAFTTLLDCANGDRPMETCAGGWMNAARRWLSEDDAKRFADYAGYYGDLIRSGKLSKYCPA